MLRRARRAQKSGKTIRRQVFVCFFVVCFYQIRVGRAVWKVPAESRKSVKIFRVKVCQLFSLTQ